MEEQNRDPDSSDDRGRWEDSDGILALKMSSFLPLCIGMPSFIPALHEDILDEGQESDTDAATYKFMPLGRHTLPRPKPGCRPVWEPPILCYTEYEEALQAYKTIGEREGSTYNAWRSHALDYHTERSLLVDYGAWVEDVFVDAESDGKWKEVAFYKRLGRQIFIDSEEVWEEPGEVRELFDKYHMRLVEEIRRQRQIKNEGASSTVAARR